MDYSIKALTQKDYEFAYKELQEFCINNFDVLMIGEFGDASCPSISDLDVFICLKDKNFEFERIAILNFINENCIRKYWLQK